MACTRSGGPKKARSGDVGPDGEVVAGDVKVLHAEPEVLTPMVATGNSARDRVAQWIYMRSAEPGITNAEIARRLGIAPTSLNSILYRARKEGWLQIEDPLTRVELELVPKVVENLNYYLDRKDPRVTMDAAKGLLYPLWKQSQGVEDNKVQVLGIKIEMPPDGPSYARGIITGKPRMPGEVREEANVKDADFKE